MDAGEPPPKMPMASGSGGGNAGGTADASKELQKDGGADLEAFLKAAENGAMKLTIGEDNVFVANLHSSATTGRVNKTKRLARRVPSVPYESDKPKTAPTTTPAKQAEGNDANANAEAGQGPATNTEAADAADGNTNARERTKRASRHGEEERTPANDKKKTTDNPWTKAREVLLRQKVSKNAARPEYDDVHRFKQYYTIARASHYRVIPDQYPRRLITADEEMTLFLWRAKKIHLEAPPRFMVETHTLRERLAFKQIQRDLLTYCLHIDTPGQLRMPAETAKFHFYTQMLAKNQTVDGPTDAVVELMMDVYSISVSAASRRAILKFTRPEVRDKWEGHVLPFPFGAVTLRSASYFEQEVKKNGLDQSTVKLLATIYLIGRSGMMLEDVYALAIAFSDGITILNIEPMEPTGSKTLDPFMWKITYNSVDSPPNLEQVRELTVRQDKISFAIGLHQPRLATRHPCSTCLETTHYRNKCPNKANAQDVRAPHMREDPRLRRSRFRASGL